MHQRAWWMAGFASFCFTVWQPVRAQELKLSNAKTWELSGLIQIQHTYSPDIEDTSRFTDQGFRVRRGRLQVRAKLTDFFETNFQIEVRDNSPRLKDAEGKLLLFRQFHLRMGQFKVPVWREELRSDAAVMLAERSAIADYLFLLNLSSRQVGVEFGRYAPSGLQFALNLSNGSGEGVKEDAGTVKSGQFTNNGKMVSGRLNYVVSKDFEIGASAVLNQTGNTIGLQDNTGHLSLLAPDFNWRVAFNASDNLEFEGGAIGGERERSGQAAQKFAGYDITGRITHLLKSPSANLGGMAGWELAAGLSWLDEDTDTAGDDLTYFRAGPALYFGKRIRLQCNGEWIMPNEAGRESTFLLRSQANISF